SEDGRRGGTGGVLVVKGGRGGGPRRHAARHHRQTQRHNRRGAGGCNHPQALPRLGTRNAAGRAANPAGAARAAQGRGREVVPDRRGGGHQGIGAALRSDLILRSAHAFACARLEGGGPPEPTAPSGAPMLRDASQRKRCDAPQHEGGGRAPYSITSSARASSAGGTSRPSAFAALRLITNSNLVDCTTGRSSGLAPLGIRPA